MVAMLLVLAGDPSATPQSSGDDLDEKDL
jgi:hypothetical protein